ncbi:hypothetical protein FN846DRAFT_894749, partial [Sphaerosporella brunnea]
MDVTRKRDSRHISNASSGKRQKLRDLSSELDGELPTRLRPVASDTPPSATVPATLEGSESRIVVRRTFDVGLPVVFGQTSFPSQHRKQQSEKTFTALQRLGEVLNPETTTTLQAYEVEEPDSPPRSVTRQKRLIEPTPGDSTSTWNFVPSWEALCIGARILKQALVLPFAFARFLVDVAPETRSQARLIEATRREQERLLLDQWNTERSQERQPSSSPLSSPPSSPLSPSPPPDFAAMSTTGASGLGGGIGPSGSGGGAGPSRRPSLHPPDPNAGLLSQFQQMIDASMAKLKLELGRKPDDPATRDDALRAELENMQAKKDAIDRGFSKLLAGSRNSCYSTSGTPNAPENLNRALYLRRLPRPLHQITKTLQCLLQGSSSSAAPSGSGRTSGGAGSSDTGNTPANDSNATLLAQIKQLIRLELQRENRADDPEVRDRALRAELHNMDVKRAAIDEERNQIRSGGWTGPTTPLSPTSIYVAPVAMTAGSGPAKPRFNPSDLPSILFGDDLEEWISQIDHIVTSFGELAVCPHILHRCFAVGDPMRDWYLTKPSEVHLFVTTGEGCWDRFKTLLRARFKPDLGVMQFEADSYRKPHGDSWAAFGIRKYRLLKRAYEGSEEANIILKMKAVMDTEVVRFCKEKSSIDGFISELMDYDRTSPAVTRSPGRIFSPETTGRFLGNQFGNPETGPSASRPSKDKGKAIDRTGQDRKSTIQNRLNPENGRMVRSYLNYQGKPVFIKHACSVCEKNGKPNQMHFSFECNYNTKPRTHIGDVEDPGDKLEVQLYRNRATDPQHETPRQIPDKYGPDGKKSRMKEEEEETHPTPVAGSSCRDPASSLARGLTRGSQPDATSRIEADITQTVPARLNSHDASHTINPRRDPEKFGPNVKKSRMKTTNKILQSPIDLEGLRRTEDEFSRDTWWIGGEGKQSGTRLEVEA